MNQSTIDLIQLSVDGEATPSQRAELETVLASSPEAREYLESIKEVAQKIESAPLVEPSRSISDDVMTALRGRTAPVVVSISQHRMQRRHRLAYGWAAAAAVVVIVALYPLVSGRKTEIIPSQAGATMAAVNVDSWPVVARVSARRGGRSVMLTVRRNGNELALDPVVDPVRKEALTIRWDPSRLEPFDYVTRKSHDVGNDTTGSATFRTGGPRPPRLLLRLRPGAGGRSDVAVLSGGVELVKTSILLN